MTNRKLYSRIQWYHFGPSRVTPNKGYERPIWRTVDISEFDGARKVKYDAQVAVNKNSAPGKNCFLRGGWGEQYPN